MMNHSTLAVALLLVLSLAGTAAWAQQPNASATTVESPAPTAKEPNTATAPAPRADERPVADANGNPYDYQSSEEISEDLSVSFPVDI
ncbi:MAG: hypothetical protein ABJ084_06005 [Halioglobus sp.]